MNLKYSYSVPIFSPLGINLEVIKEIDQCIETRLYVDVEYSPKCQIGFNTYAQLSLHAFNFSSLLLKVTNIDTLSYCCM